MNVARNGFAADTGIGTKSNTVRSSKNKNWSRTRPGGITITPGLAVYVGLIGNEHDAEHAGRFQGERIVQQLLLRGFIPGLHAKAAELVHRLRR